MFRIPLAFRAFIFGCLLCLAAGGLSVSGAFKLLNYKIHDSVLALPIKMPTDSTSLLINYDLLPSTDLGQNLNQLLQQLMPLKPRAVVAVSRGYWPLNSLDDLNQPIYLAMPISSNNPSVTALKPIEIKAAEGFFRQFELPNNMHTLSTLYGIDPSANLGRHHFNFLADIHAIANLTISQALRDGLIASLVKDRVVLIDLDFFAESTRLHTPVGEVSNSQLQALAMQNLLSHDDINLLSGGFTLILMLVLFACYFLLLQLLSPKASVIITLLLIGLFYGLTAIAMLYWQVLMPFTELVIVQIGSVAFLLALERISEQENVLNLSAELNAAVSKKVQPLSFYHAEDPWDRLHTLINQQLQLNRSIFLAKVEKDHRVKAIHALNCSVDDIKEKRRDYQRAPYSEAIAQQRPLWLQRPYFSVKHEVEREYMVALMIGPQVLGFWALTVCPDDTFNPQDFEKNLQHFAREISEILFHRQLFLQQKQKDNRLMRRFLGMKLVESEFNSLKAAVSLLENRLQSLQNIFDGMTTASVLYNLFGQIIHANKQMDFLAQQWQLPLYSLTAHDFLIKVSLLDTEQIKQQLLQVALHDAEITLPLNLTSSSSDFIVRVRAIEVKNDKQNQIDELLRLGLLIEFIDVTEAQRLTSMKKDLYSQYFHQMRNNLSTLNLLSRQLAKQLPPQQQQFVTMLQQTLDECTKVNVVIEDQLAAQNKKQSTIVPLNPSNQLQVVLASLDETLKKKRITVRQDIPTIMSLILAEPKQMTAILALALNILIDDSDGNTATLDVAMKDCQPTLTERHILISMTNEGYGIPQESLDRLLQLDSNALTSNGEPLEQLLLLVKQANYWGIEMQIESTLGSGYVIQLTIPAFTIG